MLRTFLVCFVLLVGLEGALIGAEFLPLGTLYPTHADSLASDISADGLTVVGGSRVSTSKFGAEAFRWTRDGGMVGLGLLPDAGVDSSGAVAVSAEGTVIIGGAESARSGDRSNEPFRWTAATGLQGLGGFPGEPSRGVAFGVSADGAMLVGIAENPQGGMEPMRWTQQSGVERLGEPVSGAAYAVSGDGSVAVGYADHMGHQEAFRWTKAQGYQFLGQLPGSPPSGYSNAQGISADGLTIVGASTNAAGAYEAFRWTAGSGLEPLGWIGRGSQALDASADGSVIVGYIEFRGSENLRAFLWTETLGMRLLDDWLRSDGGLDSALVGWQLFEAAGVSDDGQVITGYGRNPDGHFEAYVVTIPEPNGLSLAVLGGLLLVSLAARARPGDRSLR